MTALKTHPDKYARVVLKKGREASLLRFHPWIFSGAIHSVSEHINSGDIVEVYSFINKYLGTGHYEESSLAVKIFSFEQAEINVDFWKRKIKSAFIVRQALGLTQNQDTNAYRLVFTEGDGLPGLIIDYYNGIAVLQAQTQGMFNARHQITEALKSIYQGKIKVVYDKSHDTFFNRTGSNQIEEKFLLGHAEPLVEICEHKNIFLVDFVKGQKTGFFLDQRENRAMLKQYAKGRKVLNLFSYSGGFSVYALSVGAFDVTSVDSAASAIELANKNIILNKFDENKHKGIVADVKIYISTMADDYNLVILDPPAFAKHKESRYNATMGYKFLNTAVLKKIKNGGILFTFSCSQVVGADLFESTILAAAIEAGRSVRILHKLSQPPDHPASVFHPEGQYLKGLVLFVE